MAAQASAPNLTLNSLLNVENKICLVTGGGTGIGKMITAGLVQNGAKVYIASRKRDVIDATAKEINDMGGRGVCIPLTANLETKAGCEALANEIKKCENVLHVLVNNSGITWGAPMTDFPEKGWDQLYAVNVKGIFYLTAFLLPLLEKAANGNFDPAKVINISSAGGVMAGDIEAGGLGQAGTGTPSYSSSKAAVNHLTRTMALTLSKKFIQVNCIAPGLFPSRMSSFALKQEGAAERFDASQPMKRIGATEDMAGLALFLSSKASAHITGQVFVLDGGQSVTASGRIMPKAAVVKKTKAAKKNTNSADAKRVSPYNMFIKTELASVKAEFPTLTHREAFKKAAVFNSKLIMPKAESVKKSGKKVVGQKRGISAYNRYMKEQLPIVKAEHLGLDHKAAFKMVATNWKLHKEQQLQAAAEE
ncbi:hypothetical protein SmJEL517_g04916 [Synchytrium microbalum]|uniref:YABBY protein C-terminal domain-containing protein n=1 Tax=Synchytrium microbalum TaxID=1806994 RepID=A0A507BXM6_9FUNG|nr:uncharacterized protein SmJEL517_g04916 [Synchytrium microbalum]TPX31851.1 hypothetical protein SmJEL517_g04916 [Synchytrium microbalum]